MSRLTAFATCLAVLLSYVQAASSHVHLNPVSHHARQDHQGQAGPLHFHVDNHHLEHAGSGYSSPQALIGESDEHQDDSLALSWLAKQAQSYQKVAAAPRAAGQEFAASPSSIVPWLYEVRTHDPPNLVHSAPRSPSA